MNKNDLVSIGIPTYNRPEGLALVLNNISQQTYQNLEIIVSDNHSSNEEVKKVVEEFMEKDKRIQYFSQSENIGAPNNFNFVLKEATGEYFIWMADDDVCEPTFIEEMVNLFSTDDNIVLSSSDLEVIDEQGNFIRNEYLKEIYPNKKWRAELFFNYPISNIFFTIYGLYKTALLKEVINTHKWTSYKEYMSNSEVPFLAKIATKGRIATVPKILKKYRSHPNSLYIQETKIFSQKEFALLRFHIRKRLIRIALQAKLSLSLKFILLKQIYHSYLISKQNQPKSRKKNIKYTDIMIILKKSFSYFFKFIINLFPTFIKNKLISTAFFLARNDKNLHSHFYNLLDSSILTNQKIRSDDMNGKALFNLSRQYPSKINNGYRHIEVVSSLLTKYKLDEEFLIVDVGGASGIIAEMFCKSFPKNNIYSFEPIKESFDNLQKKQQNNPNLTVFNSALGTEKKEVEINISTRITSSSLLTISTKIDDEYFAENLTKQKSETISIRTLDNILTKENDIALIKLDVQGFELEVLKGGLDTLGKTRFVLAEVMNHTFYENSPKYYQIDEFMHENGFTLMDTIPSIRKKGKLYEWDAIYYNTNLITL